MDMDKLINVITEEVIKRVNELHNHVNVESGRILIASSRESDIFKSLINKITPLSNKVDSLEDYKQNLDCYEDIVLCGLDNRELANIALGVECGQKEQIAIKGILEGKRILLIEEGLEYRKYRQTSNPVFFSLFKEYERKLISYGIIMVKNENIMTFFNGKDECSPLECGCASELKNEIYEIEEESIFDLTNKKLISENDLRRISRSGFKTIKIKKRAILTPLAKDYIRINHINVERID